MITKEQLQVFCGDELRREVLQQPSSQGEWSCATNRRAFIWIPRMADVPEVIGFPSITSIIGQFTESGDWQPLPPAPEEAVDNCETCKGAGSHQCSCGDNHDCHKCEGAGTVFVKQTIKIGEKLVNWKYLRPFGRLPNCEVNLIGHALKPLSIRFDGGKGLLSTLKPD
jgi:hypothetical protein